jgi:hypothetical protein
LWRAYGACKACGGWGASGELVELAKVLELGELVELVEVLELGELVEVGELVESLWSLGHEISSEAFALKVSVFFLVFFHASRIRMTSYNSLSWVFLILVTFETKPWFIFSVAS